ncbi:Bardet-Biedl syndrome 5 protein [archaeon]|nr:MAG: Bardet-Biedl syndrome 5 protein [archaeon]
MRDSKFGRAIVLETFSKSGGYILGFRVDPKERINEVFKEMLSLYQVYSTTPIFGVDFTVEASDNPSITTSTTHLELLANTGDARVTEDVELIDEQEDTHAIAAYYAQSGMTDGQDVENITFDPKLGLAVETMVNGLTLEQLWRVM